MAANRPTFPGIPPLLVGREREQIILRDHLAAAVAGHGSLVLIGGEAGIGKTAVAESLCREAAEQGALVLVGRCYDVSEAPPYGPWLDLFARYRPTKDSLPLPAAFAQRGVIGAVASEAEIFNQVRDFLGALSVRQPLVLLLDDLQWADPASLALLRIIGRGLDFLPPFVLATYRVDALADQHPLDQLLPAIIREANAERLRLQPLDEGDVRALAAQRFRLSGIDQRRLVAYLQERGEGNPFFIGELLRTLEVVGVLRKDGDGWTLGELHNARVPPLVRQVIRSRLARFGDDEHHLLAIGAVIGQEIPLALWAAIAEETEERLIAVAEHAVEAHLLKAAADTTHVRFVHALTHQTLYEGSLISQRRRWHQRVGEVLAARSAPDPDAVAYHFRHAGDERAIVWLIRAGERAQRAYAFLTAGDRYEAALALQDRSSTNLSQRGWLLYRLAHVRRFVVPQEGIAHLDEASRIAEAIGDHALEAQALSQRGLLRIFRGDFGQGLDDLAAGVEGINGLSEDELAAWAERTGEWPQSTAGGLIANLAFAGRFIEALAIGEAFVAQLEASAAYRGINSASGYFGLADTCTRLGRITDAEQMFAAAHTIYRQVKHHYIHSLCSFIELRWLRLTYHTNRIGERQRLAEDTEALLRQADSAGYSAPPRFARAPLALVEGRWQEARTDALAALSESGGITVWRHNAMAILGPIALAQGDVEFVWSLIHSALPDRARTQPGNGYFATGIEMQRLAAALAIESGDLDAAHGWLEAHDRWMAWSGAVLGQAEGELGWAMYYRAAGDTLTAHHHASRAFTHASEPRQPLALLAAHRLLGELDIDAGCFTGAATHLDQAIALADACAAPYERALTLLAFAALHGASGDLPAAHRALDEARTICVPLGAKPALARADALAAQLAARVVPQLVYPDGLTAREVEVLRLVADGRSNQGIAEALSMSPRTAERHISNIYGKIHAHSRAEATAYAFQHHLA